MCRHRERTAIHRPRRGASEEANPAAILTLDVQPPELRDHLSVVEGPQSVVLCFGIPSRLTQVPTIELAQKFIWVRP